ncbi:hypothetical protein A7C99_3486 [Trichophyton rubrum]|uniref:Uncharacterized protein n=3 Tax=Trichophyton TaxID=5550 RepID=A0A178EYV5_TRIRU|nr:hypothetical protein A7C99_3486 [Trichophyton rubrum]
MPVGQTDRRTLGLPPLALRAGEGWSCRDGGYSPGREAHSSTTAGDSDMPQAGCKDEKDGLQRAQTVTGSARERQREAGCRECERGAKESPSIIRGG